MVSVNPFSAIKSLILGDSINYIHFVPFSFNKFADIPEILDLPHYDVLTRSVKDDGIVAVGFHNWRSRLKSILML